MTPAFCLLILIITVTGLQLVLASRQIRHVLRHRHQVPGRFAGRIGQDAHAKAADYTVAKARLNMVSLLLEAAVALGFTLGGGIDWLSAQIAYLLQGSIAQGLLLFAAVTVAGAVIDLPLTLYRTFVLEARFGFNRITPVLFVSDQLKGMALGVVVGTPLAAGVLWIMQALGTHWWLYTWVAWLTFSVLATLIYPTWIQPLFNTFKPLEDSILRSRIEQLMTQCGFSVSGLFVMDGSRRSAHGNAYFTGFGRTKRVVFFDTLLERLDADEVQAVLAHELGHFAHRHVLQRMGLIFGLSLAVLALLGVVSNDPALRSGLGIPPEGAAALLVFASLTLPYLLFPLQPLMSAWSRRHEFQADAYAARHAPAAALISALVKLFEDNASTLTPDPLYAAIYASHPSALTRIGRLDTLTNA